MLYIVDFVVYGLCMLVAFEPLIWWLRTNARATAHERRILFSALVTQLTIVVVLIVLFIYSAVRLLDDDADFLFKYGPWLRRIIGAAAAFALAGHYRWRWTISLNEVEKGT